VRRVVWWPRVAPAAVETMGGKMCEERNTRIVELR
jgi:hypothetical protein